MRWNSLLWKEVNNIMIYIKIIISILLMFYCSYRIGILFNKKIKSIYITDVILYGAIIFFSAFHILGQVCILLHTCFKLIYVITLFIIFITLILSYKYVSIKKSVSFIKKNFKKVFNNKKYIALKLSLVLIVLSLSIFCSYIFNENADDGFYVSLINENIDAEHIYEKYEPSLGYGSDAQLRRYEISSYELFVSILCKISHITPTIMCHTVLPFIFIILSYCAYFLLLRTITKKTVFSLKTLLILSFIFLFDGITSRTIGTVLFSKMWQGKSIFLNCILPVISSNLIKCYYNKRYIKNIVLLVITNIAGIFFTPVSLFLITFSYIGYGILLLIKKNFKKVILLGITGIPILIFAIIMLILTKNYGTGMYNEIKTVNEMYKIVGDGKYIYLYIICTILLLFIGNKRMKLVSIVIPIIYLVTIYNPIFTDIIAKYLTGSNVFWRVFWLLPIEITIAYTFISILQCIKNKYIKGLSIILICCIIMLSGKFCFTKENGFEKPENLEKIPSRIMKQTNYILNDYKDEDKPIVMCPPEPLHSVTIRQLTNNIKIFWSRDFYMLELFGMEEYNNMLELYDLYFKKQVNVTQERFIQLINKYNIDYVIIPSDYIEVILYMENINVRGKEKIDGDYIYKF